MVRAEDFPRLLESLECRLKVVKRPGRETLYVRETIGRQSIYESTGTNNQKQAEAYRAKRETELWQESVYGKRAVITFDRVVAAYLAAAPRSAATLTHVERLLNHFKWKKAATIKQQDLDGAYAAILTDGLEANAATKIRAVLTPLRAVLEFGAVRDWCDKPTFERPKVEQVADHNYRDTVREEDARSLPGPDSAAVVLH